MFEGFKKSLQDKIEKNCVKLPDLTWIDGSGKSHTETVILKRSRMPLVGDWSRIYPPVNEDGSWNIINLIFGGKKNLISLLFYLGIIAIVFFAFSELFAQIRQLEYLRNITTILK